MNKLKEFIKNNQQKLVLIIGYLLVASLGFELGHFTQPKADNQPKQAVSAQANYTTNTASAQTTVAASSAEASCQGKIKGSSSLIYHMPGGSFYDKTTKPIRCFNTEAEAKAAGFRKSSK